MRTLSTALIAGVLAIAGTASGQTLELTFNASARTLTATGNLPTLTPGGPFTVHVTGVTAAPAWVPVLGGKDVPFNSADASSATFSTTVDATVQPQTDGRVDFTVRDGSATPVTLDGSPVRLSFPPGGGTTGDCLLEQPVDLKRPVRGENHVFLMFNKDGLPLRRIPTDLDENDDITVVMLLPCADAGKYTVTLEGTLSNGEQHFQSSGALEGLSKVATGLTSSAGQDTFYMGTFGPFAPTKVTVVIKKENTEIRRQEMRVLENHIGGYRLGVARSNIRFNDFALRAPAAGGTANVVTNTSDENGDPRYFVSMVFYAWHVWDDRFWNGRDLSEPPDLLDRINPFVGVGLKNPNREFVAGFSLELARGLDVVGGLHIARTEQLTNGVTEGATFNGTRDDLPTRNEWKSSGFYGVSVDLAAGVKVLQGILGK